MVSRAKLIAEPWDVGQADSYDIGRFPPLWREWNGRYRDTMRDFWRSHDGLLGEFATRFAGSSDLYGGRGRRPTASVNLITVHDGFTLADLVSYDAKHNEANGEGNRDGTDDNRSWNCGVEGPTDDPAVLALRARQQRALLTTLLLSFGVPLLLGGDELGRTQQGNNNAYCQDNADHLVRLGARRRRTCWRSPAAWSPCGGPTRCSGAAGSCPAPTRGMLRLVHPRRHGHDRRATGPTPAPAASPSTSTARTPPTGPPTARPLVDDDFLVLVNAWWEPLDFILPAHLRRPDLARRDRHLRPRRPRPPRQAHRGRPRHRRPALHPRVTGNRERQGSGPRADLIR